MSMKRLFLVLSVCLPLLSFGMGRSGPQRLEVLVVPSRPNLVRVGMDLRERRGVVLLAYAPESPSSAPFLHVWDGREWVRVPAERYADGSFLTRAPDRVWVAGGDEGPTETLIEQAADWTPEVLNVSAFNVTEFLNAMGRSMGFSASDWKWFAEAYGLDLKDLNREARPPSWYDSRRASDLPPAENPLRVMRRKRDGGVSSGLSPIPLPEFDTPEEGEEAEDLEQDSFSFELE